MPSSFESLFRFQTKLHKLESKTAAKNDKIDRIDRHAPLALRYCCIHLLNKSSIPMGAQFWSFMAIEIASRYASRFSRFRYSPTALSQGHRTRLNPL